MRLARGQWRAHYALFVGKNVALDALLVLQTTKKNKKEEEEEERVKRDGKEQLNKKSQRK